MRNGRTRVEDQMKMLKSFLASLIDSDAKIVVTSNNNKTSIDERFKSELNSYAGHIYIGQDSSYKLSYVDPLIFYKNFSAHYPLLSRVARVLLAITATSVPYESVFCSAVIIQDDQQNRMSCELLDTLVFIKHNSKLI